MPGRSSAQYVDIAKRSSTPAYLDEVQIQTIDQDAEARVAAAVAFGDASPYPEPDTALTDVFVRPPNA
jgi:TPP-dependent pyruvate/acetoin dehydrogenase alpha subunit